MILRDLGAKHGWRSGAEIGVWRGRTSWHLMNTLSIRKLYLVDPWQYAKIDFSVPETAMLPPRMQRGQYRITMGETEPVTSQADMDEMYETVCKQFASFGERVQILRMTSIEAASHVPDASLDFAYVDSIHLYDYILDDCRAFWPKIRPGGMLCGHDWDSDFPEVAVAVHDFAQDLDIDRINLKDSVWWIQKPRASFIRRFLGARTS